MSERNPDPAELITSAVGRLWRLGAVTGQVGLSLAGNAVGSAFRTLEGKQIRRAATMVQNAMRVQEVLGRLKGAPMKMGQMLSLQEGVLPEEIAAVFRDLQDQAPPVAMGEITEVLRKELGDGFEAVAEVEPEPCAAASIGQIHRARLLDGREVVFKVQYPGIDRTIEADMKSLKGGMKLLLSWFTKMDTELIWSEVRDRMLEEIDYECEAEHLQRMRALWSHEPLIHIPQVVNELSTRRVLCMESLTGWSGEEACADTVSQEQRDQWGTLLFRWLARSLLNHRLMHVDPNLANFSFREDGGINVYDFGCVKEVPADLAEGYARLARSMLASRYAQMPGRLQAMGIESAGGQPVSLDMIKKFAQEIRTIFRLRPPYRFGENRELYDKGIELGLQHWNEASETRFPADIVFIHRTFAGHYGNLCKLRAVGPWREILEECLAFCLDA